MVTPPNTDVSAIYVAKYNRFVDTILGRINKILKDKYDPVTVKLSNPSSSKSKSKSASKKTKSKTKRRKSSSSKKSHTRKAPRSEDATEMPATDLQQPLTEALKIAETTLSSVVETTTAAAPELATRLVTNEVTATTSNRGSSSSSSNSNKRKKNKTRTTAKAGTKKPSTISSNNKTKAPSSTSTKKQRSRAKATLYGLSSLKRAGDVSVNMMSDHTTIRTKFNLGPLVLKVEKEFGRSTRKEVRSATATTAEMSGRLSLRVYHGGAATLHSIRVLQPKQMRIESADDHDRTREFVWKRSSHIAHLVSQKLSSATRSMLRPAPGLASAPAA